MNDKDELIKKQEELITNLKEDLLFFAGKTYTTCTIRCYEEDIFALKKAIKEDATSDLKFMYKGEQHFHLEAAGFLERGIVIPKTKLEVQTDLKNGYCQCKDRSTFYFDRFDREDNRICYDCNKPINSK